MEIKDILRKNVYLKDLRIEIEETIKIILITGIITIAEVIGIIFKIPEMQTFWKHVMMIIKMKHLNYLELIQDQILAIIKISLNLNSDLNQTGNRT